MWCPWPHSVQNGRLMMAWCICVCACFANCNRHSFEKEEGFFNFCAQKFLFKRPLFYIRRLSLKLCQRTVLGFTYFKSPRKIYEILYLVSLPNRSFVISLIQFYLCKQNQYLCIKTTYRLSKVSFLLLVSRASKFDCANQFKCAPSK